MPNEVMNHAQTRNETSLPEDEVSTYDEQEALVNEVPTRKPEVPVKEVPRLEEPNIPVVDVSTLEEPEVPVDDLPTHEEPEVLVDEVPTSEVSKASIDEVPVREEFVERASLATNTTLSCGPDKVRKEAEGHTQEGAKFPAERIDEVDNDIFIFYLPVVAFALITGSVWFVKYLSMWVSLNQFCV